MLEQFIAMTVVVKEEIVNIDSDQCDIYFIYIVVHCQSYAPLSLWCKTLTMSPSCVKLCLHTKVLK
jgi:hypothetical protein